MIPPTLFLLQTDGAVQRFGGKGGFRGVVWFHANFWNTYFNVSLGEYFINKINFIKKFNDFGAIFIL